VPGEAFADLDKAIANGTRFTHAFYARGRALELKGDRAGAVADYRKSIELAANAPSTSEYAKHAETQDRARLQALGFPMDTARSSGN